MSEILLNNGSEDLKAVPKPEVEPITPKATTVEHEVQTDIAPPDAAGDEITQLDIIQALIDGYGKGASDEKKNECNNVIRAYLQQLAKVHHCCHTYNLLFLFDTNSLVRSDADRIYNAVSEFKDNKPLLLVLYSRGGSPGSAYLIGKLCIDNSKGRFIITVPRMAKSAATLICCAANEIHMGNLSELGPIDPQIDELPALGLKYSVEHIADLVKRYPGSSDMFAKYLHLSLEPIQIGYYERVAESALQYAERLLSTHENLLTKKPSVIANELVYGYKDHGFVIDKSEAEDIFGKNVIKTNTPEYALGNSLYEGLSFILRIADMLGYNFYFTGSLNSEPAFNKKGNQT